MKVGDTVYTRSNSYWVVGIDIDSNGDKFYIVRDPHDRGNPDELELYLGIYERDMLTKEAYENKRQLAIEANRLSQITYHESALARLKGTK